MTIRAGSTARETRGALTYVAAFAAFFALVYPLMAVVFRLEEVAFGVYPDSAAFGPEALLEEVMAVHWPSFALAILLSVFPALVTHRVRAATARALAELAEAHRKQREFVSVISHEFRTPLTAIQGFSELISDDDLPMEQVKEFSRDINADARRLARMITEILDLDRLESGRTQLSPATADLAAYVHEALDEARVVAPSHVFETKVGALRVWADPDKLTQVLANLLSNAGKYTPPGSHVVVDASLEDGHVHVTVADDGPGIPPDALGHLFERYYRVEADRRIPGTGLGLPIVREIVELHGGRAWCESQVGVGTVFHFTLPAASAEQLAA